MFFPKSSYIQHFPMGVIGIISPWNFPFQLTMVPAISALLAGNTVVIKPSEVTPITGEIMRELFAAAKLPHGVVELIQGDGETGAALSRADIDKIFFTGSVATGRKVMAAAAVKPIPVELELGGKDAMIVCHDANLRRAAKGAVWGGLINAGQMCTSVERILVVDTVHDEFVELLQQEVDRVKVGGPEENADMGPLTFANQLSTIEAHVKDAVHRGAALLRGGKRLDRPGQFYAPTIMTDVTPEMDIYAEETFGPVLPVMRVRDENDAIRLANDHQYGLTGSVWTGDKKRGLSLAKRMHCGQVNVNDVVISVGNFALPFGGIKASGFGRYHGPEGLLSFTHQKAIMMGGDSEDTEPFWFPYAKKYPDMRDTFRALLRGNLPAALAAKSRLSKLTKEEDS
jgi:acyl-CoA reductase-like NAD-dependent aldehyde dehydrogenase